MLRESRLTVLHTLSGQNLATTKLSATALRQKLSLGHLLLAFKQIHDYHDFLSKIECYDSDSLLAQLKVTTNGVSPFTFHQ